MQRRRRGSVGAMPLGWRQPVWLGDDAAPAKEGQPGQGAQPASARAPEPESSGFFCALSEVLCAGEPFAMCTRGPPKRRTTGEKPVASRATGAAGQRGKPVQPGKSGAGLVWMNQYPAQTQQPAPLPGGPASWAVRLPPAGSAPAVPLPSARQSSSDSSVASAKPRSRRVPPPPGDLGGNLASSSLAPMDMAGEPGGIWSSISDLFGSTVRRCRSPIRVYRGTPPGTPPTAPPCTLPPRNPATPSPRACLHALAPLRPPGSSPFPDPLPQRFPRRPPARALQAVDELFDQRRSSSDEEPTRHEVEAYGCAGSAGSGYEASGGGANCGGASGADSSCSGYSHGGGAAAVKRCKIDSTRTADERSTASAPLAGVMGRSPAVPTEDAATTPIRATAKPLSARRGTGGRARPQPSSEAQAHASGQYAPPSDFSGSDDGMQLEDMELNELSVSEFDAVLGSTTGPATASQGGRASEGANILQGAKASQGSIAVAGAKRAAGTAEAFGTDAATGGAALWTASLECDV